MGFRITPQALYRRSLYDLGNGYTRFADAQLSISTGKQLRVFSDSAADAARALDLRTTIQRTIQSRSSVDDATRAADSQAELLEQASDLIAQARALGMSAASDGKSESDLAAIAADIDSIIDQLAVTANQRLEGRYLFSGSRTESRPFVVSRSFGKITSVEYAGDDIVRRVRLGPSELADIELSGSDAFLSASREATNLVGGTGLASAGSPPDTMTGTARLLIAHGTTTVGDGSLPGGADSASGLAPGASTGVDTIVGASGSHQLQVTSDGAGGGTISLDGGEPVTFTGSETDLAVVGAGGETVHLDVSAMVPGFTGTVSLAASGTIQVGDGPPQALTFTSDFVLQDGSGRAMHLDTTNVLRDGETFAVFPGTSSIFDALIGVRDELVGATDLDPEERTKRVQARLGAIDAAHEGILTSLATLGARSASFQRVSGSLEFFELSLEEKRGELEDTDIFAASIELAESQNAYQGALAAAAKLLAGPTLLNFL